MIVEADSQIITRGIPSRSASAQCGGAKGVIDSDVQVVATIVGGSNEMEVLKSSRQIRLRDVLQQTLRNGINLRDRIVRERHTGGGIEDFHRRSC